MEWLHQQHLLNDGDEEWDPILEKDREKRSNPVVTFLLTFGLIGLAIFLWSVYEHRHGG